MSEKYAIIFDPPMYVEPSVFSILFRNSQLKDMIKNDVNGTTSIHVVRLSDGHVTTLDTKQWAMILHFGNAYEIDDDTIVVEGPAYENPVANPFKIFAYENLQSPAALTAHQHGNVFKRFILNLKDKSVKMENLVSSELGAFDLPQYNPKLDGLAKNRFTYLFQLMHQPQIDQNYHWPIHKYDDDERKIVSTWGPEMTCA